MGKLTERMVNAERVEDMIAVFGSFDENIRRIEDALSVTIVNRGTDLKVSGDEESVDKAVRTLEGLLALASKGEPQSLRKLPRPLSSPKDLLQLRTATLSLFLMTATSDK